jgi:hypothetical protein
MQKKKFVLGGLGLLVVALVGGQFIPVPQTNPPVELDMPAPPDVKAILKDSCYDCHSNETVWPWYGKIAPVSWLVSFDTMEGRSKLNFSTWNRYDPAQQVKKIAQSMRQVRKGEMPPWFYTIKHTEGKLPPAKLAVLEAWAAGYPK